MANNIVLTPALLRKIVLEEKRKIVRETKQDADGRIAEVPKPTDADEYADTLAAKEEFGPKAEGARRRYHALSLQESKLVSQLAQIRENKRAIRARLLRR